MISISSYDFYQIRPVPSRMEIYLNGAKEHFQDLNSKFAQFLYQRWILTKTSYWSQEASMNYLCMWRIQFLLMNESEGIRLKTFSSIIIVKGMVLANRGIDHVSWFKKTVPSVITCYGTNNFGLPPDIIWKWINNEFI